MAWAAFSAGRPCFPDASQKPSFPGSPALHSLLSLSNLKLLGIGTVSLSPSPRSLASSVRTCVNTVGTEGRRGSTQASPDPAQPSTPACPCSALDLKPWTDTLAVPGIRQATPPGPFFKKHL